MSDTVLKRGQTAQAVVSFASLLQPVHKVAKPNAQGHESPEFLREQARAKGYAEGLETGTRKGESGGYIAGIKRGRIEGEKTAHAEAAEIHRQTMEALKAELAELAQANQDAMTEWAKAAEEQLIDRLTDLARQILCQELSLNRSSLIPMIASAVREVANARTARIRVNPFDHHLLSEHKEELIAMTANLQHLEIVDDPSIFGGAIVETDGGKVDATIDSKLLSLNTALQIGTSTDENGDKSQEVA